MSHELAKRVGSGVVLGAFVLGVAVNASEVRIDDSSEYSTISTDTLASSSTVEVASPASTLTPQTAKFEAAGATFGDYAAELGILAVAYGGIAAGAVAVRRQQQQKHAPVSAAPEIEKVPLARQEQREFKFIIAHTFGKEFQ